MMKQKLERNSLPSGITLSGINFEHHVTSNSSNMTGLVSHSANVDGEKDKKFATGSANVHGDV